MTDHYRHIAPCRDQLQSKLGRQGSTVLCALCLLCALSATLVGCRRDLWAYTDEFRQVELITDWSLCDEEPGGMTWWFINDNQSGQYRRGTTGDVHRTSLNLPRGTFTGIVFDYSPAEYSHIEFLGMTLPDSALAHLPASADQPLPNDHLYGAAAVPDYLGGVPMNTTGNGMHIVAAEPEIMNADTLKGVVIKTGMDEELIPWADRDKYGAAVIEEVLHAQPSPTVWQFRVRVEVRGMQYMYSVRGSVVGLADGCWLSSLRHTSTPCLQVLNSWTAKMMNDSVGYISTTVQSFGLPDLDMPMSPVDARRTAGSRSGTSVDLPDYDKRLRLNLEFLLRDQETVMTYHFDVGSDCITLYEDQLVVNLDIPIDYSDGTPNLPYVDSKGEAGFDADVTPWAEGGTAEQTM